MKRKLTSLLLCLCMVLALLPTTALAAPRGVWEVPITLPAPAAGQAPSKTASLPKSTVMELEQVLWSGDFNADGTFKDAYGCTVTVNLKIKDSEPLKLFTPKESDFYATVNKQQGATVKRVDDRHIQVVYTFKAPEGPKDYGSDASYVVLAPAHTREELNKKWEEYRPMYEGDLYVQNPSASAPYATGVLADGAVEDALNYINFVRYSLGLKEVTLDDNLQDRAQYGAVLLASIYGRVYPTAGVPQCSHYPAQPSDMPDAFYQRGYASTSHSNVGHYGFEERVLVEALKAELADESSGNARTAGHRLWLLNPKLGKVGFGSATGRNGFTYHTTECLDNSGTGRKEAVAWPAPGYQSLESFNGNHPFSLTLDTSVYDSSRTDDIRVKLTVTETGGRNRTYEFGPGMESSNGIFNIVKGTTGLTVVFRKSFTTSEGTKTAVEVSGVYKKGASTPVTIRWETEYFYPEYFNLTDMEFDDIVSAIEVEMDDYAKSLGQVADNTVTEADLVRAALYPMRDNRQVAFVGTHDFSKTPADASERKYGRITTTIDLTYHNTPFSVKVSAQIMLLEPDGEAGKAVKEIKAALLAAGNPGDEKAKELAAPIAAAHGLELRDCRNFALNTGDNPAYKGLKRYEVSFAAGQEQSGASYRIVNDSPQSLGVYLPLGSTKMPETGAMVKETVPPAETTPMPDPILDPEAGSSNPGTDTPDPAPGSDPAAGTQSGSRSLAKLSQTEIAALIQGAPDTLSTSPFETQPGVKAPYSTGRVKTAALQAAVDRLNLLRRLAGLPAVELDTALSEQAQYGAVLLTAAEFSHTPAKPADMDEDFYQKGKSATSSSNLHAYSSSGKSLDNSLYVLAKAPDGLMDDSDSSNVARLGHRRWQLNPALGKTGFGFAVEQSNGWINQYVTEMIYDTSGNTSDYDFIAWPASGSFPNNLDAFTKDTAWSVTLNPSLYAAPDKSALTVRLTRASDGKTWTFSGRESYTAADTGMYFNVDTSGRGVSNCIIFRPDGVAKYEGTYTVDITGLTGASGTAAALHYQVEFFDAAHAGSTPTAPATAEAIPTNDKLTVNGVVQNPTVYKIGGFNYFKIRDLAAVLNGTSKQFAVGYDAASSSVTATSGQGYQKLSTDLTGAPTGNRTATVSNDTILANGKAAAVEVYKIDGNNYFKLRDLGAALGFEVGWDDANKVASIRTD